MTKEEFVKAMAAMVSNTAEFVSAKDSGLSDEARGDMYQLVTYKDGEPFFTDVTLDILAEENEDPQIWIESASAGGGVDVKAGSFESFLATFDRLRIIREMIFGVDFKVVQPGDIKNQDLE